MFVDLRGHLPTPALTRLLPAGAWSGVVLLVASEDVGAWIEWMAEERSAEVLLAIRRGAWGAAELVVVGGAADRATLDALLHALRPLKWKVGRAAELGDPRRLIATDP
jgi:hypothetical protein